MNYPRFFEAVETIRMYDPLSQFLGAFDDGLISFSYLDCVKIAGHSCPSVAGAYLMLLEGLKALYQDKIPTRGDIEVFFKEAKQEGVTGVMATVFSSITGAADEGGFKGLNGFYGRNHLLHFQDNINAHVKMMRKDTLQSVEISYDPSSIPPDPSMMKLMQACLRQEASKQEHEQFAQLWQERVEKILAHSHKVLRISLSC